MKALRCHAFGPVEQLTLDEVPSPVPGSNDVVIAVKAAGVNFPDTLIVQGKYQVKPTLPFTPGSECSGVVKDVGREVTQFKSGDAVIGLAPYGGFAEEAVVDAGGVVPLPPHADLAAAAALMMAHGTSLHALKDRARLAAGEIPQVPLNLPLLKGYAIVGVYCGTFTRREPAANAANTQLLLDWTASGRLQPLGSARYPLAQAVATLTAMQRREVTGKVVIVP